MLFYIFTNKEGLKGLLFLFYIILIIIVISGDISKKNHKFVSLFFLIRKAL
jgi:hypothetical protein